MGRLINPDSAGKERTRLTKTIALAVRELAKQAAPGAESRDMAAYIALSLDGIAGTIDISVTAWEKRGYWVKADRFRMEWLWAGHLAGKLRTALIAEDWGGVAALAAQTPEIEQGECQRESPLRQAVAGGVAGIRAPMKNSRRHAVFGSLFCYGVVYVTTRLGFVKVILSLTASRFDAENCRRNCKRLAAPTFD